MKHEEEFEIDEVLENTGVPVGEMWIIQSDPSVFEQWADAFLDSTSMVLWKNIKAKDGEHPCVHYVISRGPNFSNYRDSLLALGLLRRKDVTAISRGQFEPEQDSKDSSDQPVSVFSRRHVLDELKSGELVIHQKGDVDLEDDSLWRKTLCSCGSNDVEIEVEGSITKRYTARLSASYSDHSSWVEDISDVYVDDVEHDDWTVHCGECGAEMRGARSSAFSSQQVTSTLTNDEFTSRDL